MLADFSRKHITSSFIDVVASFHESCGSMLYLGTGLDPFGFNSPSISYYMAFELMATVRVKRIEGALINSVD